MKIVESWLREWVNPDLDTDSLAHQLTMLGHEVDGIDVEGAGLDGVLVAEVSKVEKHPNADRLSICEVSAGGDPFQVVCGAPNVTVGMKSPLATPGVTLPNGIKLRRTKIRGVESNGMLCSAIELGLGDESDGIVALPGDAPVGKSIATYMQLPDAVFEVNLTPNRGDCFSILGIARDVAALTGAGLTGPTLADVPATKGDEQPVEISDPRGCPVFAGRVIRGIDPNAVSPAWMTERLRRSGLRPIHPVVDITNYVMLELGQPLHAYDLDKVEGPIRPRLAKDGERVSLLDEREVAVNEDTLVITDDSGVIGLAGIMGGSSTAVGASTRNVFFEAAFWPPAFMAGRARSYGLHTDASMRFERGVDPDGQRRAVERATELLLQVCGGDAGPLVVEQSEAHCPVREQITLRRSRLERLLGTEVPDETVVDILERLQLDVSPVAGGWQVVVPSHRFDLTIEADLIEEVARIFGYDRIPETTASAELPVLPVTESEIGLDRVAATLAARDYQEVVTYSFVDEARNTLISGRESSLELANPISSDMSVMRSTLWVGMLEAAARNIARQQERVRLFEIGRTFHGEQAGHREILRVSGLVYGPRMPEQWSGKSEPVDFFDIRADVEALLRLAAVDSEISFSAESHPGLQPGQSATVSRNGESLGRVGKLHPRIARAFDIKGTAFLFELDALKTLATAPPRARPVSRYPAIRRDIAVVVDEKIPAEELRQAAAAAVPDVVSDVRIFDIYQGPGIEAGLKSIAIGLILQETSRTLTDDDADAAQAAAVQKLKQDFAAVLRD